MGDMVFPDPLSPTAVDFALLLLATNALSPLYDLTTTQCYWFAGTMWSALRTQFKGTIETDSTMPRASTYKGIRIGNPSAKPIEDVLKKYGELLDLYKRERQRRQAEEAQKTEEVRRWTITIPLLYPLTLRLDVFFGEGRLEKVVEEKSLTSGIEWSRKGTGGSRKGTEWSGRQTPSFTALFRKIEHWRKKYRQFR
jgi:hypothetical protein